jgi:hypothetical protein
MRALPWTLWALLLGSGLGLAAPDEWVTLTNASGTAIQVKLEGKNGERYVLRRKSDNKVFEVPADKLKPAERTMLDAAAKAGEAEMGKLNAAAGHSLFATATFSARPGDEIASALKLRPESSTKFSKSWRHYAGGDYRLFGARPYSIALYADGEGRPTSLSVVFANKGDFGSTAGMAQDHFKGGTTSTASTLADAMKQDEAAIEKSLTDVLGKPQVQRFGEGNTRRTIKRWDWNGQSLLLSSEENEYVTLQIVPVEFAEAGGKTSVTKGEIIRKSRQESVVKEANGDVYVGQIPMVDQGPKGYCVPATFERAMRTMGIDADMYLLAMVGGTNAGGGTSVEMLLENVRSSVYRKGRRTKDDTVKELKIRDVKRYIDEGIPVMWTMCAVDEYGNTASANTEKRKSVIDWAAYTTEITAKAEELAKSPKPEANHHICMIIGYNEKTGELAVSDSWGPKFERRWVPVKVADWASQGGLFMILP